MDNKDILEKLEPYKKHITTVRKWNSFAKEHSLPSSAILIKKFDSWEGLKKELGLTSNAKKTYSIESLKEIAQEHKPYFTSLKTWENYSQEHHLPSASTYIQYFESWNEVKQFLELPTENVKPDLYTAEMVEEVLHEHGKHLENRQQWDEYAKEHKLPTYKTLKKFFTWDEVLQKCNKTKRFNMTKQDLLAIASKHYLVFSSASKRKWDEYAREHDLPSFQAFVRMFDTWKKAKVAVIKEKEKTQQ